MSSFYSLDNRRVVLELVAVAHQVELHLASEIGITSLKLLQHGLELAFGLGETLTRHQTQIDVERTERRRTLGRFVRIAALNGTDADARLHERMRMALLIDWLPCFERSNDARPLFDRVDAKFLAPGVLCLAVDGDLRKTVAGLTNLQAHASRFT